MTAMIRRVGGLEKELELPFAPTRTTPPALWSPREHQENCQGAIWVWGELKKIAQVSWGQFWSAFHGGRHEPDP